jgi:hypothetical protein
MEKKNFDFEAFKNKATSRLKNGDTLLGKDGVLPPLQGFAEAIESVFPQTEVQINAEFNGEKFKLGDKKVKSIRETKR